MASRGRGRRGRPRGASQAPPTFDHPPVFDQQAFAEALGVAAAAISRAWMKISDISVDISPIYPISVMFDTISTMTDISPIYRFWTDISWKYQVCGTRVC